MLTNQTTTMTTLELVLTKTNKLRVAKGTCELGDLPITYPKVLMMWQLFLAQQGSNQN